jgi:hypothetical protein
MVARGCTRYMVELEGKWELDAVIESPDVEPSNYFVQRRRFLNPPWASKRLTLKEIWRAGEALAGNSDDLQLFGMNPLAWYLLGIRILGRTVVEVTRDRPAQFLAESVAGTLASHGYSISDVIDPFVGSGNLFYHFLRATCATYGVGIDVNANILALTERNFSRLRLLGRLRRKSLIFRRQDWTCAGDYFKDRAVLVIIHPPWGDALDEGGLDLRKTTPPITEILQLVRRHAGSVSVFAMIQTYPMMVEASVDAIKQEYASLTTIKSDDPAIAERVDYMLLHLPGHLSCERDDRNYTVLDSN